MHYNLYIKRREARLKQREVATVINVDSNTYSLKERGVYDFKLSEAIQLANFFDCTLDELFAD